jgi:hypothetical protein
MPWERSLGAGNPFCQSTENLCYNVHNISSQEGGEDICAIAGRRALQSACSTIWTD